MRLSPHPTSLTLFPCGNLQGIHAPPLLLPLQTPKGGWVDLLLDQICTRAPLPNITSDELSTAKSKQPYLVLELLTCCNIWDFHGISFLKGSLLPRFQLQYSLPNLLFLLHLCVHAQSLSCVRLGPHGLQPTRLLCPWDSPGKSELPFPPPGDLPNPGTEPLSPQWPLAHTQLNSTLFLYRLFPWWEWALCFVCPSTSSHV